MLKGTIIILNCTSAHICNGSHRSEKRNGSKFEDNTFNGKARCHIQFYNALLCPMFKQMSA